MDLAYHIVKIGDSFEYIKLSKNNFPSFSNPFWKDWI